MSSGTVMTPWARTFKSINHRVRFWHTYNTEKKRRAAKKNYAHLKIEITKDELKHLWFRDKAYLMDKPSIDRIDSDGDYTFDNCRYIEMIDNCTRGGMSQRKPIRKLTMDGEHIETFPSMRAAVNSIGLPKHKVCQLTKCIVGLNKSYKGYRWELV